MNEILEIKEINEDTVDKNTIIRKSMLIEEQYEILNAYIIYYRN